MKMRSRGYIFFMTLCVILVVSLLLMVIMQHLLLYYKALNQQEFHHQQLYQLEHIARQLAEKPYDLLNKMCVLQEDNPNRMIKLLLQEKGCALDFDGASYHYVIEMLGEFPCLVVKTKHGLRATVHRRVSVMWADDHHAHHNAWFLQLRHIAPTVPIRCVGKEHEVSQGVSSWRFFSLK